VGRFGIALMNGLTTGATLISSWLTNTPIGVTASRPGPDPRRGLLFAESGEPAHASGS
jgi:hypothetical protein